MEVDVGGSNTLGLLAIIVPLVIAVVGGLITWVTSKRSAQNDESKNQFAQSMELQRYIDDRVAQATEAATAPLRQELASVKALVGSLHGRISRTREAVRDYIRLVRAQWGKSDQPPPVDGHLLELLGDEFDDTFTAEQVKQIVQDTPPSPTA
jgi:uncharacterized protein HemX